MLREVEWNIAEKISREYEMDRRGNKKMMVCF